MALFLVEENYVVSHYIAEFWNSITNGVFVALAFLGMYTTLKHKQGWRVFACYAALMFVGCGSACFHATLKYTTQLLDELPMLYLCALVLYALIEIDKDTKYGATVPLALIAFQATITCIYVFWIQNPIFHQVAFGLTAFGGVGFGLKRLREMQLSARTWRILSRLHLLGHVGMWGGFLAWNIDNIFCHRLRSYRSHVGAPLDVFFQLHGWWHVLTAYGSTYLLLWVHFIRLARLGHDHLFTIKYALGFLPYVAMDTPKKVE
ncbi:alkaline ceramidase ydc1 [Coemansia erecta]|uniref:Alkaline ceramidase ydc1 n=1 Tax=Coemansia erecta TaxID=147472 RepID=A0A9W7Y4W5_9FUNG|nr:alkaline ceramidase ydc1 [Coemansia erecta]